MDDRKREIILAMAEYNMNVTTVAEKLHYHRNTVDYHIAQIKKKTGLNPRNFYDLIKLLEEVKNYGQNSDSA